VQQAISDLPQANAHMQPTAAASGGCLSSGGKTRKAAGAARPGPASGFAAAKQLKNNE